MLLDAFKKLNADSTKDWKNYRLFDFRGRSEDFSSRQTKKASISAEGNTRQALAKSGENDLDFQSERPTRTLSRGNLTSTTDSVGSRSSCQSTTASFSSGAKEHVQ